MVMFNSEKIRDLRAKLQMTATQFAAHLGVSYATVASWETGRRHPKYDHMELLNELEASTKNGRQKAATS